MATKKVGKRKRPPRRPPAPAPAPGTTREEVEHQLVSVRTRLADPDLTATVHSRLVTELRGFLKMRAELEHREAQLEDNITKHPRWLALRDEIIGVVAQCDTCSAALEAVLAAKPV